MAYHINWGATEDLEPDVIDGHKSFYGKAIIRQGSALTADCERNAVRELYSYGTKVAAIYLDPDDGPIIIIGRPYLFSATTSRHFRCFTRQNANGIAYGIAAIRKAWNSPADPSTDDIMDSATWNEAFSDSKGYRF